MRSLVSGKGFLQFFVFSLPSRAPPTSCLARKNARPREKLEKIMAKRSTQRPSAAPTRKADPYRPPPPNSQYGTKPFEPVELRWIAKAFGVTVLFAIGCAFVLVWFIFAHTQWQYVLHPSRTLAATPANRGLNFTPVRFGVDATGEPQLDGWWIPSDSPSDPTVLLLHSGDGSMSDAVPQAIELHEARLNVLLFDYRGYGRSGGQHPTHELMQTDAASAYNYLTAARSIAPQSILVAGIGVGASLAVQLCAEHKELAGLILDSPAGDFEKKVERDQRVKIVPVSLLFTEDFPLTAPLHKLATPKLLISTTGKQPPAAYQQAGDPKTTLELPSPTDVKNEAAIHNALRRFLDSYVAQQPATLTPQH
jgi:pimeloyl-ACP methyl ester carboxylesterase